MTIRKRACSGLALADLVITVLIIGILAAVAGPKYADSVTKFKVRSAARRVAADLRFARQQAKSTGGSQAVVFTPASNLYDLPGMSDIDHVNQSFTVDLMKTSYPATLSSASFGAGGKTVTFNAYGRPDNGGTVVVVVAAESRTVVVDGVTGQVSIAP